MRTRFLFLAVAVSLFVPAVVAQQTVLVYRAALTGGNIVGGSGSANGFANATLTINGGLATIDTATLGLNNILDVTLYSGAAGTNGTPVLSFTDPNNGFVNGRFNRTVPIDPAVVAQIAANPQNFYLVITTSDSPGGAVRGQLAGANTVYYAGTISGSNPLCNGGTGTPGSKGTFAFALTPDPGGNTYTIRYDILASGIGNTITALQIGDALAGPGLINFGINIPGTNGRFNGTGQITAPRARLLLFPPAGIRFTVTTPDSGTSCAAAGPIQPAHEIFIPVAGSVRGAGATNFMTDLNIFNNSVQGSAAPADVLLQFFPTGAGSPAAQNTVLASPPARGMSVFRDVSLTAFNSQITGLGAVRLITAGNIFANARIYNNQLANGGGTFGQYVAGLPRSLALTEGTLLGLPNVLSAPVAGGPASARTNIGFFNPSDSPASMDFEMRDAGGAILGTRTLTLNGWQQIQMPLTGVNGLFNAVSGDLSTSSVYFLSGSPIFAYASVVDNVSGDGSFVTPSTSSNGGTSAGF